MTDRMAKADISKLSASDREYMQRISRENIARVAKLKRVKRNNWISLGLLSSVAVGIYGYTIYAVKQETFLDDFDVPAKTTQ